MYKLIYAISILSLILENSIGAMDHQIKRFRTQEEALDERTQPLLSLLNQIMDHQLKRFAVETLINQKVAITGTDSSGNSPLHLAAKQGLGEICKLLIEAKAEVNTKNLEGNTPLHFGIESRNTATFPNLLEAEASINTTNQRGDTPLHWAAVFGDDTTCTTLISKGAIVDALNNDDQTPLHLATRSGNSESSRILIAHKADVHALDDENRTPLYYAAEEGLTEVCSVLLSMGGSVFATDNDGLTALHMATIQQHEAVCSLLVANRANVSINGKRGNNSPLHLSTRVPKAQSPYGITTLLIPYALFIPKERHLEEKESRKKTLTVLCCLKKFLAAKDLRNYILSWLLKGSDFAMDLLRATHIYLRKHQIEGKACTAIPSFMKQPIAEYLYNNTMVEVHEITADALAKAPADLEKQYGKAIRQNIARFIDAPY